MNPQNKAVFLDRDGVINYPIVRNGKPYPPTCCQEVQILPGVKDNLTQLATARYLLIGITNQPDVSRKHQSQEMVETINQFIIRDLPILEIMVCYHDDDDHCSCRKPEPGLILQAAQKYDIELSHSFMVGDRWKDIEAGRRAGCRTIFIDYDYQEIRPLFSPDIVLSNMTTLARQILGEEK